MPTRSPVLAAALALIGVGMLLAVAERPLRGPRPSPAHLFGPQAAGRRLAGGPAAPFNSSVARSASGREAAAHLARGEAAAHDMANGGLFFQHVRKAGGTSVRDFLKHVGQLRNMTVFEQEWGAFPASCIGMRADTYFVTAVREPVSRIVSEFDYAGGGAGLKVTGMSPEKYEKVWRSWINSKHGAQAKGFERGRYFDNMYVREFSGRCMPPGSEAAVLKMPPCHYGQAFQGGCRPGSGGVLDVGEADLELALAVIANFDLVLVLENLGNANYQRYVHDLLNLPANFPNSFPHSNSGKHHVDLPPALRALLEDENALDLRLYDLVRALEEMKVAAWWEGLGEEGAWDEEPGDG